MLASVVRGIALLLMGYALVGCGGGSYASAELAPATATGSFYGGMPSAAPAQAAGDYRGEAEGGERYAQAETSAQGAEETRSDATSVPLLIYTAELGMAVHGVEEKEDRVEAIAREVGGFLASRTDDTIVVRVPAAQFQHAMELVQEVGDVLTRRIDVQDVTEEFSDIQTRIQTLEAMRQRVEQLLAQAHDVQAALAIEQHLERITVELEHLRGRLRFLSDRVAFSTITVRFQERANSTEPAFQLPFPWLRVLGLQRLLAL